MEQLEPVKLFKCLADKSRLMIVEALMEGPMYVELLAQRLGITPSTVSFHLKKLMDAGMVTSKKEQYYQMFCLNADIFETPLKSLIHSDSDEKAKQQERENLYRKKVIDTFFEYGKLKSIPVQQKKAQIVYEEIAKAFEADKSYTERDVNITIADFNDDFCTIRKNMVACGLLSRDNGIYKKN